MILYTFTKLHIAMYTNMAVGLLAKFDAKRRIN